MTGGIIISLASDKYPVISAYVLYMSYVNILSEVDSVIFSFLGNETVLAVETDVFCASPAQPDRNNIITINIINFFILRINLHYYFTNTFISYIIIKININRGNKL